MRTYFTHLTHPPIHCNHSASVRSALGHPSLAPRGHCVLSSVDHRSHPQTFLMWVARCAANNERAAKMQRCCHDARIDPTARLSVAFTWVLGTHEPTSHQEALNHAFHYFMTLYSWSFRIMQSPFCQLFGGLEIRSKSFSKFTQSLHMHAHATTCCKP